MKKVLKGQVDKQSAKRIPEFRSEAEEAAFWDANEDLIFDMLKKRGKVVAPLRTERTRSVTLRIPEVDIERARTIAGQKGMRYQRVLKAAIRAGFAALEESA